MNNEDFINLIIKMLGWMIIYSDNSIVTILIFFGDENFWYAAQITSLTLNTPLTR